MRRVIVEQMPNSYYFRCTLLEVNEPVEINTNTDINTNEDIPQKDKIISTGMFHENFVGQAVTHMILPSIICGCNICFKVLNYNSKVEENTKLAEQNK